MNKQDLRLPRAFIAKFAWASLLAVSSLLGAGCSNVTPPPQKTVPPPVEDSSAESPSGDSAANQEERTNADSEGAEEQQSDPKVASNSAALLLLAKSETLREAGKEAQAIALVERAIRLEPRNAKLWVQLGRLNFEGGDLPRAEQYARRGIAIASADDEALRRGWLLLADISDVRGDIQGARQIRSRWLNARG